MMLLFWKTWEGGEKAAWKFNLAVVVK